MYDRFSTCEFLIINVLITKKNYVHQLSNQEIIKILWLGNKLKKSKKVKTSDIVNNNQALH
jgi:hypothetical protein